MLDVDRSTDTCMLRFILPDSRYGVFAELGALMFQHCSIFESDRYALSWHKFTLRYERCILALLSVDVRLHMVRNIEVTGEARPCCIDQRFIFRLF